MSTEPAVAAGSGGASEDCWVHASRSCRLLDSGLLVVGASLQEEPTVPLGGENVLEEAEAVVGLVAAGLSGSAAIFRARRAAARKRMFSYLPGIWHQYHPTYDRKHSPGSKIWVSHEEVFTITRGRVTGNSEGQHIKKLAYTVESEPLDNGPPRFRYQNRTTDEPLVDIRIFDVLHEDLLFGTWTGHDYDGRPASGPIIYSRKQLPKRRLNQLMLHNPVKMIGTCTCTMDGPRSA